MTGASMARLLNPYPLNLNVAVEQAYHRYAPAAGFDTYGIKECVVSLGAPARESALVVSLNSSDGTKDVSAYMFIQTAGWAVIYIHHHAVGDFAESAKAKIQTLKRECARWP
jgi:hypothetical protein